jgi:hypothetical protein
VIVPIYWKAQKETKIRVVTAAHAALAALTADGVRCEIDLTLEKTPGQKFAYWEYQGVLTRVEIGPRDAEQGTCTLARTDAPGTPARRRTGVSTRADILVPVVRALMVGGADALGELTDYAGPIQQQPSKGAGGKRARGEQEADVQPAPELAGIGPARPGAGGDDLAEGVPEGSAAPEKSKHAEPAKRARAAVVF